MQTNNMIYKMHHSKNNPSIRWWNE